MCLQRWFGLAVSALVCTSPAHAQGPVSLSVTPAGSVVRLTWAGRHPIRARLLEPLADTADTVRFCRYPTPACWAAEPRDTLRRARLGLMSIERRQGHRALHGALVGAISGGAAAMLVLIGTAEGRQAGHGGRDIAFVVSSSVLWMGLGALIGSGQDRWVPCKDEGWRRSPSDTPLASARAVCFTPAANH
jgi:hypothetical protein